MTERTPGRPRAASRELLEEAACELFLERGYAQTAVADITERAGVSRSTFFNYVTAKSDLLWARFDDAVASLSDALAALRRAHGAGELEWDTHARSPESEVAQELRHLAALLPPENVALAFSQSEAMGLGDDLRIAAARRLVDVRDVVERHLAVRGRDEMVAQVRATGYAGALLAAVRAWSLAGAGSHALPALLDRALASVVIDPGMTDGAPGPITSLA